MIKISRNEWLNNFQFSYLVNTLYKSPMSILESFRKSGYTYYKTWEPARLFLKNLIRAGVVEIVNPDSWKKTYALTEKGQRVIELGLEMYELLSNKNIKKEK